MIFNSKNFETLRCQIDKALEDIAEKNGIKIEAGKVNYGEFDFKMTLNCVKQSNGESGIDGEREKFNIECVLYGFKEEHYDLPFTLDNEEFVLTGFNRRAPKNNCHIKSLVDGKKYRLNDSVVKRCMGI